MRNSYRLIIASVLVALVILLVIVFVYYSNKKSESFDSTQTSNGIVVLNVINTQNNKQEYLSNFKTNRNSVLLIDGNGNLKNLGFPLGLVIPWAPPSRDSPLPNGWSLCDGTTTYTDVNGTTATVPDLVNRFVLGASDTRGIGSDPGGEETVTLQSNHLPQHTHNIDEDTTDNLIATDGWAGCDSYARSVLKEASVNTETSGGGQSHNNMPPWYILRYICYTGIISSSSPSSNKILVADNSGNTSTYTTNNNSLLITDRTGNLNSLSFFKGMIMMWYSTTIPDGWALCDGNPYGNFTVPDLRSRFILGESPNKPFGTEPGGEETVTLSSSTIPSHTHNVTRAGLHDNCYRGGDCSGDYQTIQYIMTTKTSDGGTGSGNAHNNMPPYYVLAYICYVGNDSNRPNSTASLILTDTYGNLNSPFKTKNNSLVLTDSSGILKNLPFPKGLIIAWYNKDITDLPPGWSLCNGTTKNGYLTPDLRGKFIYGYDSRSGRGIGNQLDGEETVQLNLENVPSHTHNAQYYSAKGYGSNQPNCWRDGTSLRARKLSSGTTDGGNVGNSSGNADPHNNMPPYFVLTYICYTGENL